MIQEGKMSVLLVGNYAQDRQFSMLGFSGAMATGLARRGIEVKTIAPVPRLAASSKLSPSLAKWLGYLDKYAIFPRELKRASKEVDLVHICDQGNAMYTRHLQSKPHVLTCHDVLAIRSALGELPYWHTGKSGKVFQSLILAGLKAAHHICCVSTDAREGCLRLTGLSPDRVVLVYNGPYEARERMAEQERNPLLTGAGVDPAQPYILHVGGNQPYKNRVGVVRIFSAYKKLPASEPTILVLAGKAPPADVIQAISHERLEQSVVVLKTPSSETITALYSGASMLLFPSLAEGFGMPIIEAQGCGCPVVTTNRAPMTEVGGEAAVYIDPEAPSEAAEIIRRSEPERQAIVERGYANAKRFSVDKMVDGYFQAYGRALA